MRKLIPALIVTIMSLSVSAQYKKAGFFEKEGRTYELASQIYMMGKENGNPIGYKIAFGRDQDGKRWFKSWDLQVIPPYKYSYTTTGDYDEPMTVSGKSNPAFIYGLNWGYHLLNNESEEKPRLQPFIGFGLSFLLAGGAKTEIYSPETANSPKRRIPSQIVSMGLNGGLGCLINISEKFAVKLQGGYAPHLNISTESWGDDVKPYFLFTSHAYASLGLRIRVVRD